MSSNDLLSQDEIDALLHGVDLFELEKEVSEPRVTGGVAAYDFFRQDRIVHGQIPVLDRVATHFARALQARFSEQLDMAIEVSVKGVQAQKFAELSQGMFAPTSVHYFEMQPLQGTALLALDARFVFRVVEWMFGGNSSGTASPDNVAITPVGRRVLKQLVPKIMEDLEIAWAPVAEVQLCAVDTAVTRACLIEDAQLMIVTDVAIRLQGSETSLQIAIPYNTILPIIAAPSGNDAVKPHSVDSEWQHAISEQLQGTELEVSANLLEARVTLRECAQWRVGDIVPITLPEEVVLQANGKCLATGECGVSNGKNSITVARRLHDDAQNDKPLRGEYE